MGNFLLYMLSALIFILFLIAVYWVGTHLFRALLVVVPSIFEKIIEEVTQNTEAKVNLIPQTYDEKLSSLDELFKRSADYKNSKNFKEALAFVIKIKNVAPFNAWLLRGQNPDITHVATANDWANKFNRALNPKARAYVVMNHTPVGFVYDIADTVGGELPIDLQSHFRAEGVLDEDMIKNTIACCHKKKIIVEYDNTIPLFLAGRASHGNLNDTKIITINAEHSKEIQFSTLCHEIAHLMLGHLGEFTDCQCKDRKHLSKEVREIEAESVSWLVCDRLGIKTDAERYLNGYLHDPSLLEDISINNILITAGRIESMALKKECNIKKAKS